MRTVSLQWKRHFDGDLPFWLSSVEVPGCQMAFELSFFRWHLQSHQWHSSWNWLTTFFSKSQLWGDWRDFFYRSLSYVEGFFFPQSVLPDIFIRCSSTWAHEIWVVTVHNNSKILKAKDQKVRRVDRIPELSQCSISILSSEPRPSAGSLCPRSPRSRWPEPVFKYAEILFHLGRWHYSPLRFAPHTLNRLVLSPPSLSA